jgi:hypothetical protein
LGESSQFGENSFQQVIKIIRGILKFSISPFTLSPLGHGGQLTLLLHKFQKKMKKDTGPGQVFFEKKKGPNELETKKGGYNCFYKCLIKIKIKKVPKKVTDSRQS